MASAAVRFHLAAAQEAESTYNWYAARSPEAAHGFREELRRASRRSRRAPGRGRALVAERGGTYSRGTPSVSCTSFAVMPSRSLRWPMVVAGPATGGRAFDEPSDFDKPSNVRMQLAALRAAADTAR